ncbi:hypothetical protein [Brevibacillus gelatini]
MIDQFVHHATLLAFMAILVEAVTEITKNAFPSLKDRATYILSIFHRHRFILRLSNQPVWSCG